MPMPTNRLPSEIVPGCYIHEGVWHNHDYVLADGRMPTLNGRAGQIADRSVQRDAPQLHPVFMLGAIRGMTELYDAWILSVLDRDYYPSIGLTDIDAATTPWRYTISLWDADRTLAPDVSGDPTRDIAWEAMNPYLEWPCPVGTTLEQARAGCERLAWMVAHGEIRLDPGRKPSDDQRLRAALMAKYQPHYARLLAAGDQDGAWKVGNRCNTVYGRRSAALVERTFRRMEGELRRAVRPRRRASRPALHVVLARVSRRGQK